MAEEPVVHPPTGVQWSPDYRSSYPIGVSDVARVYGNRGVAGYVGPPHPAVAERDAALARAQEAEAQAERLRVLVQALEEENAARTEDGERLAREVRVLHHQVDEEGICAFFPAPCLSLASINAHDALTARYAPGAPIPSPDPVEGDSGTLSDQAEATEVPR